MAEKDKKKKPVSHSEGMGFGTQIILLVLAVFIIWVLMGGAKKAQIKEVFTMPEPAESTPIGSYGSSN